jgi:hypothetical protein
MAVTIKSEREIELMRQAGNCNGSRRVRKRSKAWNEYLSN